MPSTRLPANVTFTTLVTDLPRAAWQQVRFGGWRMLLLYVILQGVVTVILAPVLRWVFVEALAAAGLRAVDMSNFGRVFNTPLSLGLLLLLSAVAMCAVSLQLTVLVLATRRVRLGEQITAMVVLGDMARVLRKLLSPGSFSLLWYVFIVLPLAQFGFLSVLTHAIAIPSFITGELVKSTAGLIGYILFLVIAGTINVRLALTIPIFALSSVGGARAMRLSWKLTARTNVALQIVFVGVMAASALSLATLVALSIVPTALTDLVAADLSPAVAAASLGVAQLVGMAIVGFTVMAFAAVLVELFARRVYLLPVDVAVSDLGSVPHARLSARRPAGRRRSVYIAGASVLVVAVGLGFVNLPVVQAMHVKPDTLVLGHRGFSDGGVENTLSGLDAASAAGADLVEMDVMQTSDGFLVAMHDANLSRLAGQSVNVADLTLAEITQITVEAKGYSDLVPSFHDYVKNAKRMGMPLLIELKLHGGETPGFVDDVIAELESQDALESNMYHSLHKPSIEKLKTLRPALYTGYTMAFAGIAAPDTIADFIVVEEWSYTRELRDDAWANGLGMFVWTVNDGTSQRQLLRDEVDGMVTDQPVTALSARDEMDDDDGLAMTLLDALMRFVIVV